MFEAAGMTSREAREVVDLWELAQHCSVHGPISLELYAQVRKVDSLDVETWERNARRLVQRLRLSGFHVVTMGDAGALQVNFASRPLRAVLDGVIDRAERLIATQTAIDHFDSEPDELVHAIVRDWDEGRSIEVIRGRYRMDKVRVLAILRLANREPRPQRRLRLEERLDPADVLAYAHNPKRWGLVSRVARERGVTRATARRMLERLRVALLIDVTEGARMRHHGRPGRQHLSGLRGDR